MTKVTKNDMAKELIKLLPISKYYGRLNTEAAIQNEFVTWLISASIEGKIKAVWSAIPNDTPNNKNPLFGMHLKALGKVRGAPDMVFLWDGGGGFIEFKSIKGRQSEYQKLYNNWCNYNNIKYCIARSSNEAIEILKQWGVLT